MKYLLITVYALWYTRQLNSVKTLKFLAVVRCKLDLLMMCTFEIHVEKQLIRKECKTAIEKQMKNNTLIRQLLTVTRAIFGSKESLMPTAQ